MTRTGLLVQVLRYARIALQTIATAHQRRSLIMQAQQLQAPRAAAGGMACCRRPTVAAAASCGAQMPRIRHQQAAAALQQQRRRPRTLLAAAASGAQAAAGAQQEAPFDPQVCVVLGTQWGDEGKGKLVDILAQEYEIVARAQVGEGSEQR